MLAVYKLLKEENTASVRPGIEPLAACTSFSTKKNDMEGLTHGLSKALQCFSAVLIEFVACKTLLAITKSY